MRRNRKVVSSTSMFLIAMLCFSLFPNVGSMNFSSVYAQDESAMNEDQQQMLRMDYEKYVSRFDLHYNKLMDYPRQGLPIGNGRMGSLVHATPSTLQYFINRVDIFQSGAAGGADECCTAGDIAIDFGGDVFDSETVEQHLSFYNALATVKGEDVTARTFAWSDRDVIVLNMDDRRRESPRTHIDLKMNTPDNSEFIQLDDKIVLKQVFNVPSPTGISENDHYNSSATVIHVPDGTTTSNVNDETIRLTVDPEIKNYSVLIASASTFDRDEDVIQLALDELDSAVNQSFEKVLDSHKNWWHDYWSRSFIHTPGQQELIEKWVTFFYYAGSSFRGEYPAKFNGSLWHVGDRPWGTQYWGYNQGTHYYPLETANHRELLEPLFNMTSRNFERYRVAAEQQWGTKGIHISQTEAFDGPEVLPENIAAELREVFLYQKPISDKLLDFAEKRNVRNSRWNILRNVEKKVGYTSHWTVDAGIIADFYWNKYQYTQDRDWLRDEAYPIIKGVAEFYANFPNLKKEEDGLYHLYYTHWAETAWGARDSITSLTIIRGVLPIAIKAAEELGVDEELVPRWKDILENLAPYPTSDMPDQLLAPKHPGGHTTFAVARKPVLHMKDNKGTVWDWWIPQLLFFDALNMESENDELKTIAQHTLDAHPAMNFINNGELFGRDGHTWSRFLVKASRMGREDIVEKGLPLLLSKTVPWNEGAESQPNRLPYLDGPYLSMQELGTYAESLQSPLLQDLAPGPGQDSIIHVFPAWPEKWDVSFKLLAKGGFLVHSTMEDGKVQFVELDAQIGGDARLKNPWLDSKIDIYRNGVKSETLSGSHLIINTTQNENIVIVKEGDSPDDYKQDIVPIDEDATVPNAAEMKILVEQFEDEGEFANHGAARSLQVHLTAVSRYEERELAEKVVKHMEGFKLLLDHQKENGLISERAYNVLRANADSLIKKWQ